LLIIHRRHKKDFLLKFRKELQQWRHWLFEAKRRSGLQVLHHKVTSNHIHLLTADGGNRESRFIERAPREQECRLPHPAGKPGSTKGKAIGNKAGAIFVKL
jgi:hypothetical protein